jgi:hypothetical protein
VGGASAHGGNGAAGARNDSGSAGDAAVAGQGATDGEGGAPDGRGGAADLDPPEFSMGYCVPTGPALAEVPGVEVIDEYPDTIGSYLKAVALHDGILYWAMWGEGIYRRASVAAPPELLVDTTASIRNVVANDDYIYWIQDNAEKLMRASLATAPATPEEVLLDVRALGIKADADNLYFIRQGAVGTFKLPFVEAVPGGGATPVALVSDVTSAAMSPNHERLFYVTNQTLYSVPLAGGAVKGQGSRAGLHEVLATDDTLYAAADEDIYKRVIDGPTNGTGNTPLARGNLTSATSSSRLPLQELHLDGDRLYYREDAGALAWVKTDGSDCRIIAKVPAPKRNENLQWVMDDAHFYVIQEDKKLLSIPK